MSFNIDDMKAKILLMSDPDSGYTLEDFDKEFNNSPYNSASFTSDFSKLEFKFANNSSNTDPEYATDGSSGFDLRANLTEDIILSPKGGFAIVPTGLFFEIPSNLEIQIRSRSGLAAKNQVVVLNSPGTIDADYRGEIKVILMNHGSNEFTIKHGDRIAQAVIASVISKPYVKWTKVDEVSNDTSRGSGGFGSTGVK